MVTCACHAAATDWSANPICSIAATKPTVDMPMPPHSSGTSMPSRPNAPISRSRSVGHRASSHAGGARRAISFSANSRQRLTRSRSDSVSEKSTRGYYWTGRYKRARRYVRPVQQELSDGHRPSESPYRRGNRYDQLPIPMVAEHCIPVDAGAVQLVVESRRLTNSIIEAPTTTPSRPRSRSTTSAPRSTCAEPPTVSSTCASTASRRSRTTTTSSRRTARTPWCASTSWRSATRSSSRSPASSTTSPTCSVTAASPTWPTRSRASPTRCAPRSSRSASS